MSILIVDDTEDNVTLLKAILKNAGHSDIQTVDSGENALQRLGFHNAAAESTDIEIILMDIMMPGMSGIEVCRHLSQHDIFKNIPIIMVTARVDVESIDEAFKAGAMDYVTKPVRKIELLARINSAMKLKREADRRRQRENDLEKKNAELEKAISEIKVLRGFLPICAHCKKIRDVKGYWQQMEAYLQNHSGIQFSHSICQDCLKQHYSDLDL